jgi:atypical dual specificity phosphatase
MAAGAETMTAEPIPREQLLAAGDALPRPHGDCYWVLPGRLLAGAHPAPHLPALLDGGIDSFVDLTHPQAPPAPYALQLGTRAAWQGFAVIDYSVPGIELMRRILRAVDASLAQRRRVYLHCHAGVGRTGTAVGCWLVERGLAPAEALALITAKRRVVARFAGSPQSPETDAQREFVKRWTAPPAPPAAAA